MSTKPLQTQNNKNSKGTNAATVAGAATVAAGAGVAGTVMAQNLSEEDVENNSVENSASASEQNVEKETPEVAQPEAKTEEAKTEEPQTEEHHHHHHHHTHKEDELQPVEDPTENEEHPTENTDVVPENPTENEDNVNPDEIADAIIAENQVDPNDIDMVDVVNFDEIGTIQGENGQDYTAAVFHDPAGGEYIMVDVDHDDTFDVILDQYGEIVPDQTGQPLTTAGMTVDDVELDLNPEVGYMAASEHDVTDDLDLDDMSQDILQA